MWVFGECFFSLGGPAHQSVDFGFKSFLPFGQLFSHLLHWAVPPPSSLALCQTLTLAGKQKAACCPPWMSPSLGSMNKPAGMLQESKAIIFPPKGKKIHFHGCARVKTPQASCVVWSLGSKRAPNRTSEVKSFCLSIPLCLPLGHWGRRPDSDAQVVFNQQSSPTSMGIKRT